MRERPILFSGPMVQGILANLKRQTRRVVKPQPQPYLTRSVQWGYAIGAPRATSPRRVTWRSDAGCAPPIEDFCPHGRPGDRLWVKETWSKDALHVYPCPRIWYRADIRSKYDDPANGEHTGHCRFRETGRQDGECFACAGRFRWKPSIFMRRADSRITLEITEVRVERLHAMSFEDWRADFAPTAREVEAARASFTGGAFQREHMQRTWDNINGAGSWEANPWVWAITFRAPHGEASNG